MKSPSFGRCTVYVKETTAAPGYALDENVYSVNIEPKTTAKLNGGVVYDTPQNDPVNILLKKVDKQTGKGTPQGSATLKGAQFTVRYYDTTDATSLSKDYATRVSQAKKTWVYETQSDGTVRLQHDTPISGDPVYKDLFGDITLPVGTYVIEETLAPTGYLLPNYQNRTYIEVVRTTDNSANETTDTYHKEGNVFRPSELNWSEWKIEGEE